MRRLATSSFQHLVLIERKKLAVFPRPPGKRVNTIEAKHMIDPKKVEDAADAAHSLPPPIEIVCAHRIPPIKRDAPVLSPLLSELVIFKIQIGRASCRERV